MESLSRLTIPPLICRTAVDHADTPTRRPLAFSDKVHIFNTIAEHGRNTFSSEAFFFFLLPHTFIEIDPHDTGCDLMTLSLPDADSGDSSNSSRCGERAPHPAEALEEEPRRAQFQVASEDARRAHCYVSRAAQAPGPAAEPHHHNRGASADPAAQEGQGREEKQEEKEHEETPCH